MGRSTKKQLSEIELLQQENKELRSINKSLSRKLKEESKKYKPEHSKERMLQDDYDAKILCPQCQKGNITKTSLGPRVIIGCSVGCGYRSIVKNDQEKKEDV